MTEKLYMDFSTGELWTLDEVREQYELFKHELPDNYECGSFEDYLHCQLILGRNRVGGLIEEEVC